MLIMCVQWTANCSYCGEEPRNLHQGCEGGNPCGSDLVFGAWSPKWGTHSGLFVHPQPGSGLSQAVTAFLLLLFRVILSKISLFEGLKLARLSGHRSEPGYSRTGIMLDKEEVSFWGSAVKSVLQWPWPALIWQQWVHSHKGMWSFTWIYQP